MSVSPPTEGRSLRPRIKKSKDDFDDDFEIDSIASSDEDEYIEDVHEPQPTINLNILSAQIPNLQDDNNEHGQQQYEKENISDEEIEIKTNINSVTIHHFRQICSKCQCTITFENKARIIRCAVCQTIQPVKGNREVTNNNKNNKK
jgi:hypothetical protein